MLQASPENRLFASKISRGITQEARGSILKAAGLDETHMKNWHIEFEMRLPKADRDFGELTIQTNRI